VQSSKYSCFGSSTLGRGKCFYAVCEEIEKARFVVGPRGKLVHKTTGTYIILVFGFMANTCSIAGVWLSYASAPPDVQARFSKFLLVSCGVVAPIAYLVVAGLLIARLHKPASAETTDISLRSAEERIVKLEQALSQEQSRKELELPASRPKIVPIRWDKSPDGFHGLIIKNYGEPALDISVDEPILIGTSQLDFWGRTYSGLTMTDGELLIDSHIELANGVGTTGQALRDEMRKANLEDITLRIKYGDMERSYTTTFELVREFWGNGLRVTSVRQQLIA